VDGEKKYVRHLKFIKGDRTITRKLVYDYVGPVP
jgi:hypothetical protein